MKRSIMKCLVALLLIAGTLCGSVLVVGAEGEMAYNIYVEPEFKNKETGKTESLFDSYTIEFSTTKSADATYWSLANFGMYISEFTKKKYRNINGGGAYAGLQDVGDRNTAIMAFWEWTYNNDGGEDEILTAHRIYPYGPESYFGGEGEGVNWITTYPWKANNWYRILLHSWTDKETGTTFVGEWFEDKTTGTWNLVSYFDTKMIDSCFEGNMHFFMENFVGTTANLVRDVRLKGIYAKLHSNKEWMSVDSAKLMHCNNWANNKIGMHIFGANQEYFWAEAGGPVPEGETQAQHDNKWQPQIFTLEQPDQPTFGKVNIEKLHLGLRASEGVWYAKWTMDEQSTPQLSYDLQVTDVNGKTLLSVSETRPEIFYKTFESVKTDAFLCKLTITDPFGNKQYFVNATEAYLAQKPDTLIGAEGSQKPANSDPSNVVPEGDATDKDNQTEEASGNTVIIIIAAVAGVALVGVLLCVLLLTKKKK